MNEKCGNSASLDDINAEEANMTEPQYWAHADRLRREQGWEQTLTKDDGAGLDWAEALVKSGGPATATAEKRQITVRFDQDVIDWFKSQGKGYQTRMNAVLRHYMEHEKKAG